LKVHSSECYLIEDKDDSISDEENTPKVDNIEVPMTTPEPERDPPTTTFVMNSSILIQFQVYRPYLPRPAVQPPHFDSPRPVDPVPLVETPHAAETPVSVPTVAPEPIVVPTTAPDIVEAAPTEESSPAQPVDETASEDSDDTLIVDNQPGSSTEAEGVKRRWFREEMRQSPVRSFQYFADDRNVMATGPLEKKAFLTSRQVRLFLRSQMIRPFPPTKSLTKTQSL